MDHKDFELFSPHNVRMEFLFSPKQGMLYFGLMLVLEIIMIQEYGIWVSVILFLCLNIVFYFSLKKEKNP